MNFVPCIAWVPRGKAASTPQKLQLSAEELKCLVDETKEQCGQSCIDDDFDEDDDNEDIDSGGNVVENEEAEKNEEDDFVSRYNLDAYDNDDDQNPIFNINDLALHVDNKDDDYISDHESESEEEEKENFVIKESDNLLVVGHVEDESSVLEIHVYNPEEDTLYVHHDIVLSSYPLALEWLDFNPLAENAGNFLAVGDMSPVIQIWDLDIVDVLEPDFVIGKISKKKAKKQKTDKLKVHSDAVLSLSWNKLVRTLLASGSADSTVILWDLEKGKSLNQLSYHSNKVQALQWHPSASSFLLSGCTDGLVKLYDCRSPDSESKSWSLRGEIERIIWNLYDSFQFFCSTDQGFIHSIDIRNHEILRSFPAHNEAVTGLDISPLNPTLLISAGMDNIVKVWDIENNFNMKTKIKVGSIYTAKMAPDLSLTVAVGGNCSSNSLKVIDLQKDVTERVRKKKKFIPHGNKQELKHKEKEKKFQPHGRKQDIEHKEKEKKFQPHGRQQYLEQKEKEKKFHPHGRKQFLEHKEKEKKFQPHGRQQYLEHKGNERKFQPHGKKQYLGNERKFQPHGRKQYLEHKGNERKFQPHGKKQYLEHNRKEKKFKLDGIKQELELNGKEKEFKLPGIKQELEHNRKEKEFKLHGIKQELDPDLKWGESSLQAPKCICEQFNKQSHIKYEDQ